MHMAGSTGRTYTFNHPWALLLTLPLLLLATLLVGGLALEFNLLGVVVLLFTVAMLVPIVVMGFLRRVKFDAQAVHWISLKGRRQLARTEIKHFGVVKYRAFKFIYLSVAAEDPFKEVDARVEPSAETVLFQFRRGGWEYVQEWVGKNRQ